MKYENPRQIRVSDIRIQDSFWSKVQNLIIDEVIPYQERILHDEVEGAEKSAAIRNYRIAAGLEKGEFYGFVFQDSDVAKWLEGVAYALAVRPDPELMRRADEVIDLIGQAQQEDGYLDTYFIIKEPDHKWQNLQECHELYCAGHLMEAAAAYYRETGKDRLLQIASKLADLIGQKFGPDKEHGVPGHQEVENGLLAMYRVTGEDKYRELAFYFINERGQDPDVFSKEQAKRGWYHFGMNPVDRQYSQIHAPVRQQKKATGHAVRAVYMYMAMAELAREKKDDSLYDACRTLWDNIVRQQMYITGGIGSTHHGEAFTFDYDLPNDSVYAETCASVAMVMFAKRMLDIEPLGEYADIMEKELFNTVLSGMQLDGKSFFYVNPLEVVQGVSEVQPEYRHVVRRRPKWYACACCPPNIVRLITSLGTYGWTEKEDTIWCHLLTGQKAELEKAVIEVESGYPWDGAVRFAVQPKIDREFTLAVHVPEGIADLKVQLNGEDQDTAGMIQRGYLYITKVWKAGDSVSLDFALPVLRNYADPRVRSDAGCTALTRGPVVYCFEQTDQEGKDPLQTYRLPADAKIEEEKCEEGPLAGMTVLHMEGLHLKAADTLYSHNKPEKEKVRLTAVPYYAWSNREEGDMRVWIEEE